MAEKPITVEELRDRLSRYVEAGGGGMPVYFGGAEEEVDPFVVVGGWMSAKGLILAPIKLNRVMGGF